MYNINPITFFFKFLYIKDAYDVSKFNKVILSLNYINFTPALLYVSMIFFISVEYSKCVSVRAKRELNHLKRFGVIDKNIMIACIYIWFCSSKWLVCCVRCSACPLGICVFL